MGTWTLGELELTSDQGEETLTFLQGIPCELHKSNGPMPSALVGIAMGYFNVSDSGISLLRDFTRLAVQDG